MKKTVLAVLLCALLFAAAACSADDPTEKPELLPTSQTGGSTEVTAEGSPQTETEEPVKSETTVDRAAYTALAEDAIAKAAVIGRAAIDAYPLAPERCAAGNYTLAEKVRFDGETPKPVGLASVWHYTSYYAMTSRLARLTDGEDRRLFARENGCVYAGFAYYRGTADVITYEATVPMTGYGVNRAMHPDKANVAGDQMVYDDQMWIVRAMLYSYESTGERQYFDEARRLADLCVSGWDSTPMAGGREFGGIPWGPSYASKHTCSNAPILAPLVGIYEILHAEEDPAAEGYLAWAEKIYAFTYDKLKNADNTFGDLIGTKRRLDGDHYVSTGQGSLDPAAYSYNTGAMISGAASLYRATGKEEYLTQGKRIAAAAAKTFSREYPDEGTWLWNNKFVNGKLSNDGATTWFNLVLLEGLIELSPYDEACEDYILRFLTSLDYGYEHFSRNGFLPRDLVHGWDNANGADTEKNVMDQASAAEMYALIAEWARGIAGIPFENVTVPMPEANGSASDSDGGEMLLRQDGVTYRTEKVKVAASSADKDADYLLMNAAQSNANERYADNGGFLLYRFDLSGKVEPKVELTMRQDYKISVSADDVTYTEIANFQKIAKENPDAYPASAFNERGSYTVGQNRTTVTVDPYEYGITGTLYIMIEDATPEDGWGGTISALKFTWYAAED